MPIESIEEPRAAARSVAGSATESASEYMAGSAARHMVGSATASAIDSAADSAQVGADTANRGTDGEVFAMAQALIGSRRNVSPKRLVEPGPSAGQLATLFALAAAAPDHGLLTPWRFIIVPEPKRALLAEMFALALIDRDPGATLLQIEAAREKAHRAPLLVLAVARLASDHASEIPDVERIVSLGCAVQNLLLAAHAMGYGSGLTSGQAMASPRLRALFGLGGDERAVCFVNVGSVTKQKPARVRPAAAQFVSTL